MSAMQSSGSKAAEQQQTPPLFAECGLQRCAAGAWQTAMGDRRADGMAAAAEAGYLARPAKPLGPARTLWAPLQSGSRTFAMGAAIVCTAPRHKGRAAAAAVPSAASSAARGTSSCAFATVAMPGRRGYSFAVFNFAPSVVGPLCTVPTAAVRLSTARAALKTCAASEARLDSLSAAAMLRPAGSSE